MKQRRASLFLPCMAFALGAVTLAASEASSADLSVAPWYRTMAAQTPAPRVPPPPPSAASSSARAVLTTRQHAHTQIDPRFWDPRWRRVGIFDYAWAGTTGAATLLLTIFLTPNPPDRINTWGGILFDDEVRDALRIRDPDARRAVSIVGHTLFGATIAYPFLVDVPVAWSRGGSRLAWEFLWQSTLVMTTTATVDLVSRDLVLRARPEATECLEATNGQCPEVTSARSFPGGHVIGTSAAAGLICTQHLRTHLYGGPWDAVTCGLAEVSNVAVGVLRIAQDVHWTTDTIVGVAIGSLIGFGLPHLLWYNHLSAPESLEGHKTRGSARSRRADTSVVWAPTAMRYNQGGGLGLMGIF